MAPLIKLYLETKNYTVFKDTDSLPSGDFRIGLKNAIRTSKSFILVCSENSLDACINDVDVKDFVHKEVKWAMEFGCTFVPLVMKNFKIPSELPETSDSIRFKERVQWNEECKSDTFKKILSHIGDKYRC